MAEDLNQKSDQELITLSLTDQQYFGLLIRRYEKKLLRYIFRISNFSKEDSEDVLQEVFIKVYQNLNAFNPKLKFSSWLYRITHNQVISTYRKHKVRPQVVNWEVNQEFISNIKADFDLAKNVDEQFFKDNIKIILNKIDFKYSQVLILKFLEHKTYQEISDILQKPEGTIASLINRAKKQFKKEIAKNNIKF